MTKLKRTLALVGVILVLSLYVISFISALFANELSSGLFLASFFSTVTIPIMIYGFIAVYKHVHRNDPKLMEPQDEEDMK